MRTLVSLSARERELNKGFYSDAPARELLDLIEYQVFSSPTQRVESESRPQRPDRPLASEINRPKPGQSGSRDRPRYRSAGRS